MFIRLKMQKDGSEININVNHIEAFGPTNVANTSTTIRLTDGSIYEVEESSRSIRGYAKKAVELANAGTSQD